MDLDPEIDERAMRIVTRAVQELGGAAEMVRRREQELLPALVESAYVLVMREEQHQPVDEIARFLGISPGAVEGILAAPTEMALARIRYRTDPAAEFDWHTPPEWSGSPAESRLEAEFLVGALAKFAHGIVRREEAH